MNYTIKIHPSDNVAVALRDIKAGESVFEMTAAQDIPAGHKVALRDIQKGESIVKYGYSIGSAVSDIKKGEWVHNHNLKTGLDGVLTYRYEPVDLSFPTAETQDMFLGFVRTDGSVGVRNEVWIIPTVGCVNAVATNLARAAEPFKPAGIDAVVGFPHPYGCSQIGEDQENARKVLANLINHPNAGGVLVLGLGCENSGIEELKPYIGTYDPNRVKFLVAQECEDEFDEGMTILEELMSYASSFKRQEVPISKLIVGLKCGGSDGFSGITANPAIGGFSDQLIRQGGTTILTEVPEMFGAETILMNRCVSEKEFDETVHLINDFKQYYVSYNQPIYENPSPGNKKGGISTLEDKSLGCTMKAGSAPVTGVLSYGEPVKVPGLNLLSAPGNDLVASTALVASGAQIVLFATGRGTPFACPVPTVKISSNPTLAKRKHNWIDFNAGEAVEGKPIEVLSDELYAYVKRIANGEYVKSELAGMHDMAIFKTGVTL